MRSEEYWAQRAIERMIEAERMSFVYLDRISQLYDSAKRQIFADIENIFSRYLIDSGLGRAEARELLSRAESREVLNELRSRIETVTDPKIKRELLNRINAPAYRSRISRLKAVEASIDTTIKMIAPNEVAAITENLLEAADHAYYRTLYDIQRGTGIGFSFEDLNQDTVDKVIREQWSGKHFSDRVWTNTDTVSAKVQDIVRQNVLTGRSWQRCRAEVAEFATTKGKGALFASERLLRTETNYVYNEIKATSCQAAGAEYYNFLAVLDKDTSETCRSHDGFIDPSTGKKYSYENKKPGENFPPLHAFCRSTTTPRLDPDIEAVLKRRAVDPKTGKISQVPYTMTYQQWRAGLNRVDPMQLRIPASPSSRITREIGNGNLSDKLSSAMYNKHVLGSNEYDNYLQSRRAKGWGEQSRLAISSEEAQKIIDDFYGTGIVRVSANGIARNIERVNTGHLIGYYCERGEFVATTKADIHYGKRAAHLVPVRGKEID